MNEECKVNYLDVQKSLDILKILSDSFSFDRDEEPTSAPPPAFPNAEYNAL
jgi:hypothetical protein